MLPYLENLHFPSPPGSSAGSPQHEGGETVKIFNEAIPVAEYYHFIYLADGDRASAEAEEGGAGEGGGGGGCSQGGQQAAVGQEEVQDHLLH